MCGMVRIGGKALTIQKATEKMNNIGLDAGDFFEAMHTFNLKFPLEFAITSTDGRKGSTRGSSQEIVESEAI